MQNKYSFLNGRVIFSVFVFLILPIVYLQSTIDPDIAPRFFLTSCALLLFSVLLHFVVNYTISIGTNTGKMILLLSIILLWTGFSMIFSINSGDAFLEWIRLGVIYAFCIVSFIIFSNTTETSRIVSRGAALAVLLFSLIAFIQFVPLIPDILKGKVVHSDQIITSSLGNKNFFSEVLVLLIPLLIFGCISEKKYFRFCFFTALLSSTAILFLLQSISAWIASVIAFFSFIVFAYWTRTHLISLRLSPQKKTILIAIILIIVISCFFMYRKTDNYEWLVSKMKVFNEYVSNPALLSETRVENNNSVFERLILWRNTVHMIGDHPWFGVGLNNWKIFNPAYGISGTQYINSGMIYYEHPHNDYLLVWAEQGIIGLLIYLFSFFFIGYLAVKGIRTAEQSNRLFLLFILSSIIAFMVMSLFSYPRSRFYSMLILMINFSLILAFVPDAGKRMISKKYVLFCVFLLAGFGVFASYSRLSGEVHMKKLLLAKQQNNFARMIREADKASSWFFPMDLTSTPISWYKGMAYFYSKNIPLATEMYENALIINPNHLRILNDLGTTYEQGGEKEKAIRIYKRALEITPLSVEVNLNLSAAYYNLRNIDSSFFFIDRVYKLPLSWKEEQDYKKFLNAILYAKAYLYLSQICDSTEMKEKYDFLDDPIKLKAIYEGSKGQNQPFTKFLRNYHN